MKPIYILILLLCFSFVSFGQTIQWMQSFDTSNAASPAVKLDSAGNSYLYNAIFTGVRANIVKYDKNGNLIWAIKMVEGTTDSSIFLAPLVITVDDQQNVYGLTTELSYTGFNILATNGIFHLGPTSYDSNQHLISFKLDKDGNFLWSSDVGCFTATINGISYDKYTNTLYPIATYALALYSSFGNLVSPATDNSDVRPVSFFWAVDGDSGKIKALKNLYVGQAGTIVPLPDRVAYFTSNMYTYDVPGNYLQLDHDGTIQQTKPISLSQLSQFQGTDVSSAYYYDTGATSDIGILGYYDYRNRIRKIDFYGNPAKEQDFFAFDTIKQQKIQAFTNQASGIKAINDKNVLLYATNLNNYKTFFLGDSLSQFDFRLVFMDENFNVRQNIKCSSSSYLIINSFDYNKSDSSFNMLLVGNQANTIKIGSAIINIPPHDFNVNYTYLVKIKFDNVALVSDNQTSILSMVYDQQAQAAVINDTTSTVNSVAQPGTNLSSISPVFTLSEDAHFKTPLAATLDLSKPLTVTVVSSAGVEKDWTISIIKTLSKNNIDTVSFPQQLSYLRDTIKKTIQILVDRPVDLHNTNITNFKSDTLTTVSPNPSSVSDFSSPVIFNVTADNGNVAKWTITVARKLSSANDIVALQLASQVDTAHINDINKIITLRSNTLNTSIANITLSPGASLISPLSSTIDFTNPVTFEVQAENGDVANWTVNVTKLPFTGLALINVYPMPATNVLNVVLSGQPNSATSINFSSVYGQTFLAKNIDTNNSSSFNINVSGYPPGIYLLNVTIAGQVYTKKIIVKH